MTTGQAANYETCWQRIRVGSASILHACGLTSTHHHCHHNHDSVVIIIYIMTHCYYLHCTPMAPHEVAAQIGKWGSHKWLWHNCQWKAPYWQMPLRLVSKLPRSASQMIVQPLLTIHRQTSWTAWPAMITILAGNIDGIITWGEKHCIIHMNTIM